MSRAEEEAAACRKAFEGVEVGALVQHCHHEQWLEPLTEPAENRILFIIENKAKSEQAERLRRFRPFDWKKTDADWKKAYADWEKAAADWEKAYADWEKASADWEKASADWEKASADWKKTAADWKKTAADRKKADADWKKAYADWKKASADWASADWAAADPAMLKVHAQVCGCPWDATHDIFGYPR